MKDLVTLVAASALFVPLLAPPAYGQHKPLPPAFGKELVPNEQTAERNEPKQAELEEEQDRQERSVARPRRAAGRGGKVHIELDGDEDGGGDEGDDGGDF